jgi:general secretion pathway protein B
MSLILDALKKADQERREREQAPNLDSPQVERSSKKSRWPLILFVCLIIVAVTTTIILFQKPSLAKPNSASQSESSADYTAPPKAPSLNSEQERLSDLRKKYQAAQNNKRPNSESAKKNTQVEDLYSEDPESPPKPEREIAVAQQSEPSPPSETRPSLNPFERVKSVKQLPYSIQEKLPSLMYEEHHFSNTGRSSIKINGRTLRENASLNGIKLISIHAEGSIFSYQGQEFRLPARNSWINLN